MKNFAKSAFFVAGCAATVTLFNGLGLTSPEHEAPAHNEHNEPAPTTAHSEHNESAPKVVRATAKTPTTLTTPTTPVHSTAHTTEAAPKSRGVQIETTSAKPGDKHVEKHEDTVVEKSGEKTETKQAHAVATETDAEVSADEALARLQEGNGRWVADQDTHPHADNARRTTLAEKGQNPFATILTCADSRIPVEQIFDQGVGDLFTIRVAGNVAGVSETGTIEYSAGHLKTPLLVVMGHTKCGAVGAAASNAPLHGMVAKLVSNIQPAVERAKRSNPGVDDKQLAALAVRENVWQTVFDLYKNSDELRELVSTGKLKVVGAVYDIATGKVEFMGEHPWQGELLGSLNGRSNSATAHAEGH